MKTINRQVFPLKEYPYGQYDYQVYFEQSYEEVSAWFEKDVAGVLRAIYAKGNPREMGKPGMTAAVTKQGGWLGGSPAPPLKLREIPADSICIDEVLLGEVRAAMEGTGFEGANAWYLNHQRNRAYSLHKWRNDGYLHMPVLFIGANWDPISDIAISSIADAQKQHCTNLREVILDAGHWVALEKPEEVNTAIVEWLVQSVPGWWPRRNT